MAGTILQEGGRDTGAGFDCGRVTKIAAAGLLRKGGWCGEPGFCSGDWWSVSYKRAYDAGAVLGCGRMPEIAAAGAAERGMVR